MQTEEDKQRKARSWAYVTLILVVSVIAELSIYDVIAFSVIGGIATISTLVGGWFKAKPIIWFGWCLLTGHLVWMGTPRTPREWSICIAVGTLGLATGIFVTWLRDYLTTTP